MKEDEIRKTRYSEEQITHALKQVGSEQPLGEICRRVSWDAVRNDCW